ncbi:MAG: hypothetical protein QHG99_05955 [Methanomicrobiales archaeon]|nr:hypothetical protein [Methanomicrobiales archaeon]
MQLPRGIFQSIRKGAPLREILGEMGASRFTGYLSFFIQDAKWTVVLEKGRLILADCGTVCGKAALELLSALDNTEVDAELFCLTDAQVELTREFNKNCVLRVESEPLKVMNPAREPPREPVSRKEMIKPREEAIASPHRYSGPVKASESPKDLRRGSGAAGQNDDLSLLDTMDLERIAEKMKENSRVIAEKLELDHLVREKV